jgi:hypothetical protein
MVPDVLEGRVAVGKKGHPGVGAVAVVEEAVRLRITGTGEDFGVQLLAAAEGRQRG